MITARKLFLTSALLLFVELILIRWVPANVVYVGFFNNFLLIGSFLGIGVGILLARKIGTGASALGGPLLLVLTVVVTIAQVNMSGGSADVWFGATERRDLDVNFLVLPSVVVLVAATMAVLALPLGPLLRSMPPLRAYAVDVAGSMSGIAAFAGLAVLGLPPAVWFGIAAILAFGLSGARRGWWSVFNAGGLTGAVLLSLGLQLAGGDRYSPYYRLNVVDTPRVQVIFVNGLSFQAMFPAAAEKEAYYDQVYRWFPGRQFRRALFIGAGSGTDVAVALAHGVRQVDAVEIDPGIVGIGASGHPDRPYQDPRVRTFIDDGRSFLRNSSSQYDLIVYAVTDSLTLVSSTSNLRLESFLFTEESFRSARDHLAPDGVFVMYNYYREPWLIRRYADMLESAFGAAPGVRTYPAAGLGAAVLAAGPLVADPRTAPRGDAVATFPPAPPVGAATDDWPFPYLRERTILPHYVVALALMLLLASLPLAMLARTGVVRLDRFSPHFFALGVAFLLLETRSIVTFSLLFGTTWYVNTLVFFAILASVLAAIAVNARLRLRDPRPLYAALLASLALAYFAPPSALLVDPPWLRYGAATVLSFSPVFLANLIFTHSFRDTLSADTAFASNLLGAVVGGILEWLALVTGYQALLVLVAGAYLAAYGLARARVLGDALAVAESGGA